MYTSKIENYQCDKLQKENLDLSNSKKESFHGKNDIFESYNNKSSYNFEDIGIIRDFTSGKLFKIYQAIPFDINNEIIQIENKPKLLEKNKFINNNNYIEINECTS